MLLYIDWIIDLKKSSLPKKSSLYFVTVSCFQLSPLIIFENCMLCLVRKNWASNKNFEEILLKVSKKFAQWIAHFIPFCKVELFETNVKSERKTD